MRDLKTDNQTGAMRAERIPAGTSVLYPNWTGPVTVLPDWIMRSGLRRYSTVRVAAYISAGHWQRAELDGIGQVAPILVLYNQGPADIRRLIGKGAWRAIHHGTLRQNVDRLALCMIGGWSITEAIAFPKGRKVGLTYARRESQLRYLRRAAPCAETQGQLEQLALVIRDIERMGGRLPDRYPNVRAIERQHDRLVAAKRLARQDPTPWSDPWSTEIDGYTFTLLRSARDLDIEGAKQHHCVASYAEACRQGRDIVLRIEGPERATASWSRNSSYIQVQGFANTEVSKRCADATALARRAYREQVARK